jgi:hypothetical protein
VTTITGQSGQTPADFNGSSTAHTGVDLVEDESGHRIGGVDDDLDREHHPGQLSTGSPARQRSGFGASVRLQQQAHEVATGDGELRCEFELHLEDGVRHRQGAELGGDQGAEAHGGRCA